MAKTSMKINSSVNRNSLLENIAAAESVAVRMHI